MGDTVAGFLAAAVSERTIGDVVNVGSGREISIGDLVHLIRKLVGRNVIVETDEQRVRPAGSEVERLLADNRKAKQIMGWEPKVSLEDGFEAHDRVDRRTPGSIPG